MEKWKDVIGYEGKYMVSDKGRIKSLRRREPKILKTFLSVQGYPRINLMNKGKLKQVFVHRLVAESFIKKLDKGHIVNHIDGDKQNNNLTNLEIVTQKENVQHSLYVLGNGITPVLMLDKDTFEVIDEFANTEVAGREMNIDSARIWRVCNWERNFVGGYSWMYKHEYNQSNIEKRKRKINKGLRRKKVYQIDPNTNEVIKTFDGVRLAEKELGISNIKHCVAGLGKTAGGYKWSYEKP